MLCINCGLEKGSKASCPFCGYLPTLERHNNSDTRQQVLKKRTTSRSELKETYRDTIERYNRITGGDEKLGRFLWSRTKSWYIGEINRCESEIIRLSTGSKPNEGIAVETWLEAENKHKSLLTAPAPSTAPPMSVPTSAPPRIAEIPARTGETGLEQKERPGQSEAISPGRRPDLTADYSEDATKKPVDKRSSLEQAFEQEILKAARRNDLRKMMFVSVEYDRRGVNTEAIVEEYTSMSAFRAFQKQWEISTRNEAGGVEELLCAKERRRYMGYWDDK